MDHAARIAIELYAHPTFKIVRQSLGDSGALAFVGLVLWASTRPGGDLGPITPAKLAAVSGWNDDPKALYDKLRELGVIVPDGGTLLLADWQDFYIEPDVRVRGAVASRWGTKRPKQPAREDDDEPVPLENPPRRPPIPYQQIVALYHKHMPDNPQVRDVLSGPTKSAIRARWNESQARRNLNWWADFFTYAGTCPHLIGRTEPTNGHSKAFMADLMWLVNATNMEKTIAGRYD